MPSIEQIIDNVEEIAQNLKDAKKELTAALEETDIYKRILTATLKQTSSGCTVPDKVAQAHALKVTLSNYKKTKKGNPDD